MNITKHYLYAILVLLSVPAFSQTPPATWQEHWFEHNQLLNREYYDNDVAVYHDNDVNPATTWMNSFSGDIWRYVKRVYGDFGSENRLYAIFHTGKYGGGHPSTYFDAGHDYRNVIDIGTAGNWDCKCGWNIDVISHEIAHIVELGSKGVHGSPAFGLWGDSKWAEIFNYDIYINLGMSAEATRTYNTLINSSDNFPRAGTYWFRDWFYPIYRDHGGAVALNRYFELLAQYFPKNGNNYSRGMNWGEFVHFWSGAAGADLKARATAAFGWTSEYEAQFNQAKIDFPFDYAIDVTVYADCNYRGYGAALTEGRYNLSDLQARGVGNDKISSIKVPAGYQVVAYNDINFAGTSLTVTTDNACLTDEGFNDIITSLVVSRASSSSTRQIEAESYSSMSGVALEACTEGGQNVGWIETGDWMAYSNINFPSSGTYLVEYRVASAGSGRLSLDLNAGSTVLGELDITSTGGWQTWATRSHTVTITAGTYNVGIYVQAGGWNINWIRFTKQGAAVAAAKLQAEVSTTARSQQKAITNIAQCAYHEEIDQPEEVIRLYPNPVTSTLQVQLPPDWIVSEVTILNGEGNPVKKEAYRETLDVSSLKPGIYSVVIRKNGKQIIRRFIKK
jgi:hypothetical protein